MSVLKRDSTQRLRLMRQRGEADFQEKPLSIRYGLPVP